MKKYVFLCTFSLFLTALASAAGERGNEPIQITSDQLITDSGARTATFTGKVVAQQADVTIHADKVVVLYSEKDRDVEKVEAFGNVRISQGVRLAQSGHALYDNRGGKIILDDNPKVYQGENVVKGKVINYFVNDERSVVTGGPDARVEATIHPKSKGENGGARP